MTNLGTSLWLQPPRNSPIWQQLATTIQGLKPIFSDSENFEPHITLTSNISVNTQGQVDFVLDRAVAAAKCVPQGFQIHLSSVKYGSRFFKKVYLQVEPTPELLSLARICREDFVYMPEAMSQARNYQAMSAEERQKIDTQVGQRAAEWTRNEYDPHVSLVYSDLYPVEDADRRTIETRLEDTFGSGYDESGLGWKNGRFALVRCEGPVDEWEVLGVRDF